MMNITRTALHIRIICAVSVFLAAPCMSSAQSGAVGSPLIEQAREVWVGVVEYHRTEWTNSHAQSSRLAFDKGMKVLAGSMSSSVARILVDQVPSSPESWVLQIAADYKLNPGRHEELDKRYSESAFNKSTRGLILPQLILPHSAPEYRLAWEKRMLMPWRSTPVALVTVQALSTMGDARSLMPMLWVFEVSCSLGARGTQPRMQYSMIESLRLFPLSDAVAIGTRMLGLRHGIQDRLPRVFKEESYDIYNAFIKACADTDERRIAVERQLMDRSRDSSLSGSEAIAVTELLNRLRRAR